METIETALAVLGIFAIGMAVLSFVSLLRTLLRSSKLPRNRKEPPTRRPVPSPKSFGPTTSRLAKFATRTGAPTVSN